MGQQERAAVPYFGDGSAYPHATRSAPSPLTMAA